MIQLKPIDTTVTVQDWEALSQMKLAFGHQSVGSEVILGIKTLAEEHEKPLTITETRQPFTEPAFHHFLVGRNEEPYTKLSDFADVMTAGVGKSADVALMKLCFVDIKAGIDPEQLARAYITELERLSTQFPNTSFVAVTAPLTTVQSGPRAFLKKLIRRSPAGYERNAQRQVFNDTLRVHYAGSDHLFDIARIESGFGKEVVEYNGLRIETLDPALTYDGGHLNDQGKRLIGGALVHHLARFSRPKAAEQ